MNNCNWEKIRSFRSPNEFKRFENWLKNQEVEGVCEELKDDTDNLMSSQKKAYICLSCNQIWELLFPDPGYYKGSWLPKR